MALLACGASAPAAAAHTHGAEASLSRPRVVAVAQVTLLAESFGGCLALRLAAAAPHLVKSMVLLNPATCYNKSLNGLSSLVSATNLLGLFPQDLYNTAQVRWAGDAAGDS